MDTLSLIVFGRKYGRLLSDELMCEFADFLGTDYGDTRWYVQRGGRVTQVTAHLHNYVGFLDADYYDYRYGWRISAHVMVRRRVTGKQPPPMWAIVDRLV